MDEAIVMFIVGLMLGVFVGMAAAIQCMMPGFQENVEKHYEDKLVELLRRANERN
jgi:uncharacterized protein YneF (UPF0154 family)